MRKPSSGGIPAAIVKRLRTVRYAVGDLLGLVGRTLADVGRYLLAFLVAAGRGAGRFWRSLSLIARRRLVAAVGAAALLLILFGAVVPNLPCQLPGGDSCPPADDAEQVVPADALAYLRANLDPESDQFAAAAEIGEQLPALGGQLSDRVPGLVAGGGGEPLEFARIDPWFADDAAVAVLAPSTGPPQRVELFEVSDADGAREYAASIAVGEVQTSEYEGVEVSVDQRDVATAQAGGFLVIGTEDGVEEVIATATGADGAESLADNAAATDIRDLLPDQRFAEAWLSADGIETLVAGNAGALGTLAPLAAPGASSGLAASLSAGDDELELAVRSALDSGGDGAGFFAAFPPFEPTLAERLRPATLAYLAIGEPAETIASLLSQAGAQAPGIALAFKGLVRSLRRDANVDLEAELVGALGDQAAVALEPAPGGAGEPLTALPYLLFLAEGVDEEAVRRGLAALAGQAPGLGQGEVEGVETSTVRLSPAVELTYAVFDELAAVATNPVGIAGVAAGEGGLDELDLYRDATDGFPDEVALQAYFDLGGLVTTGEQAGLAEDPVYAPFAGEFRRLEALALAIFTDDDVLATDARLLLGPGPADEAKAPLPTTGD
ncbi:MAG TPA: DUF3352 domain-containing protein [Solirubrobacterales bacterium]|nr:DUF3352 domain-containing protein [Solirubrobacterales bacterium]